PRGAAGLRAPPHARHVLHPPLGGGPRAAARRGLVVDTGPALRRAAPHAAAAGATARGVSLYGDRRHAPPPERRAGSSMISVAPLDGSLSVWDAFAAAVPGRTCCHRAGGRAGMEGVVGQGCWCAGDWGAP